jgi:hypothetical protein
MEALATVLIVAIIVFGVVGGALADTLMKKILPLLEAIVQERRAGVDLPSLLAEHEQRGKEVEDLEARLRRLEEQVEFMQQLTEPQTLQHLDGASPLKMLPADAVRPRSSSGRTRNATD